MHLQNNVYSNCFDFEKNNWPWLIKSFTWCGWRRRRSWTCWKIQLCTHMKTQLKGNSSIEDVMIMTLGNKSENSKYALLLLQPPYIHTCHAFGHEKLHMQRIKDVKTIFLWYCFYTLWLLSFFKLSPRQSKFTIAKFYCDIKIFTKPQNHGYLETFVSFTFIFISRAIRRTTKIVISWITNLFRIG